MLGPVSAWTVWLDILTTILHFIVSIAPIFMRKTLKGFLFYFLFVVPAAARWAGTCNKKKEKKKRVINKKKEKKTKNKKIV